MRNCFMKAMVACLLAMCCIATSSAANAPRKPKTAYWICMPGENLTQYGVYEYQKTFKLESVPSEYKVEVSADNKYKLYVNDKLVSTGPSLGDARHWYYHTVDLAPYLTAGNNIVRAVVWNDGNKRAVHQVSVCTGFILFGIGQEAQKINSNGSWQVRKLNAYHQLEQHVLGFYALEPGEFINMNIAPSAWTKAIGISAGLPSGSTAITIGDWELIPSVTPQMSIKTDKIGDKAWTPITIPANTKKTILLDNKVLTNAYFNMLMKGGKGATVVVRYAEALYGDKGYKNNRNETAGKYFIARNDSIILPVTGNQDVNFTTLNWRTYRYVGIDVQTGNEPLTISDVKSQTVRYPFSKTSQASCSDKTMEKILEVGWRTLQLCAMDTYTDCPYYEQLQYVGDTRIQAMITYFNTADDRLPKKAIQLIDASRNPDGLTQSRYPSDKISLIPPFSLHWIGMVYDYSRYRDDAEFIKKQLNGVRQVLHFFELYQEADGRLKDVPYWQFTDWAENAGRNWKQGAPVPDKTGHNGVVDLQLLSAYQMAAKLEAEYGEEYYAEHDAKKAALLAEAIKKNYYDKTRGLFADNADKKSYSQHANTLAILTGIVTGEEATAIGGKIINEKDNLVQASIYYQYYVNQALCIAGFGDGYIPRLDIWRKNLELGLTTWGEDSKVENTRSDCHAWGANPNVEYYRTVLGIDSDAPGFKVVKIEPHLGTLTKASGTMPHPQGLISASYVVKGKKLAATLVVPDGVKAYFVWKGEHTDLHSGENKLNLKM